MDFELIDKTADSQFKELERRIWRLQSGGTIDSLKTIGAETSHQIGASFVSLKQLAVRYTPNEQLAKLLWNTEKREEQIVACFLIPTDINKEKIMQLFNNCLNTEIAGYLGSVYLYKHPQLVELAEEFLDSGLALQQVASLTALAKHLIINKKNSLFSKEYFSDILNREYKDKFVRLTAERYRFNL